MVNDHLSKQEIRQIIDFVELGIIGNEDVKIVEHGNLCNEVEEEIYFEADHYEPFSDSKEENL